MKKAGLVICSMELTDLSAVLEIEREAQARPWTEQIFREELERELARLTVIKQDENDAALGFCNYWLVHDEVHILNIAVKENYRRKGLGQLLLEHIIRDAVQRKARVITLEVRKSNHGAILLYRSHDFVDIGVRKAYYADNKEDALVMHCVLQE